MEEKDLKLLPGCELVWILFFILLKWTVDLGGNNRALKQWCSNSASSARQLPSLENLTNLAARIQD